MFQDPPFVFQGKHPDVRDNTVCSPSACFYGYAVDLLKQLAEDLQFNFVLRKVKDNKYGSKDYVRNMWNGIIGELIPDENGQSVQI